MKVLLKVFNTLIGLLHRRRLVDRLSDPPWLEHHYRNLRRAEAIAKHLQPWQVIAQFKGALRNLYDSDRAEYVVIEPQFHDGRWAYDISLRGNWCPTGLMPFDGHSAEQTMAFAVLWHHEAAKRQPYHQSHHTSH